ncbi:MAG: coproporphyrinogen III oxidase [Gemmatimonadetes bacterium]|nr:MAG: coproporphyrinogen III oxidase [Gemmatimonadota bacterium]
MRHLYLHVPFCQRRCSYCDFSIAVRKQVPAREYVDAVLAELQFVSASSPGWVNPGAMPRGCRRGDPLSSTQVSQAGGGIETLYLGGGTPSLLPPEAISALLTSLLDAFRATSSRDAVEVTLEANPEDVKPEIAAAWRRAGVNRVSLGAQSFDDGVLKWMHRSHDATRISDAVRALRAAGFDNISLDLIFALPVELERDWARDLDLACSLQPAHLSLYGLTVEERTPLARWISRGATAAPDDDRYAEEYLLAHSRLAACGYHFYEVSNAARNGHRSRHNSAYWSGQAYLGLGPAAHSFDGRARRWNLTGWESYRRAVAAGQPTVEAEEILTEEQRELEQLYLALRTTAGLPVTALYRPLPPCTAQWVSRGWAEIRDQRLVCSPEGWLRLDALVRDLTGTQGAV